jgi:D-alanyl-D-alanine dipeptidase
MITDALDAGGYADVPLDTGHERSGEPLVPLPRHDIAGENYYARTDGENPPYFRPIDGHIAGLWARQSVAEKLARVNLALQPWGLRLFVWDAYRPVSCQAGLWAFAWEQARREAPEADAATIHARVLEFVSDPSGFDPDDPATAPTHATGGAVDLTLQHLGNGALAEMGAGFDEMSPRAASDYYENALKRGEIAPDDTRLLHRRLLHAAMRGEGFVNYPPEFWHFDWGTQMYVRNLAALGGDAPGAAWYGYVRPPEGDARGGSETEER